MERQQYYQNVVHHYTGGLYFDEVHFQNNKESVRYERNGISLGKSVIKQNMNSFYRYTNLTLMNLDFFAVRPLIAETDIEEKIEYQQNKKSKTVTLIHRPSENKLTEYTFKAEPLRLLSINNKTRKRIYIYDDYRYSNGYFFAHSLIKKYNGDTLPSFITRIEKFEEIEKIENEKLTLPDGYYKVAANKNKSITIESIAKNLYLVSDSSSVSNTLVKTYNNEITVLGASRNSKMSKQIITAIKKYFPNKKIIAIYVTHPYSDHISGLLPYVDIGAKIIADTYTVEAIKAYPYFSDTIEKFTFETITHGQKVNDIRFYVLENSRSKRQSFAYFKQSGIIFQSDFLEVAFDNTVAKILPSYSKSFIEFIKNEKLKINRIVGFHRNNNISPVIIDKSYKTNTM
jgi:hypothetical protein